jgi:amino acid transporter
MSELKEKLISQIDEKKIKVHSKKFFLVIKALLEVGVIAAILLVIFIVNLSFYLPRKGIGLGQNRISNIIGVIPWPYVALGIVGLAFISWFIYKYTGAYKKGLTLVIALVSLALILAGFMLSVSDFNEKAQKGGGLRHFYNTQEPGSGSGYRGGRGN